MQHMSVSEFVPLASTHCFDTAHLVYLDFFFTFLYLLFLMGKACGMRLAELFFPAFQTER